jgi:general stress protein 26
MTQVKTSPIETYQSLIKDIKTGMLTTQDSEENLHSRPMYATKVDDHGVLWFFTDAFSGKVDEIKRYPNVNVNFASPNQQDYLSISGKAYLIQDRAVMKDYFSTAVKAWFPKGLDDPKLALLRIVPDEAEYWDATSNKAIRLFKLGKALAKGEPYDGGKHEKIHFQ